MYMGAVLYFQTWKVIFLQSDVIISHCLTPVHPRELGALPSRTDTVRLLRRPSSALPKPAYASIKVIRVALGRLGRNGLILK
jgi:hypothetical protein